MIHLTEKNEISCLLNIKFKHKSIIAETWDGKTNLKGKHVQVLEIAGKSPEKELRGLVIRQHVGALGMSGGDVGNTIIIIDYEKIDGIDRLFLNQIKYKIL